MRKLTVIVAIFISLTFTSAALAANTAQQPSHSVKHVVKAKETLSGIAAFYHVTVQSIVSANHLSSPDKLQIGQVLIIPDKNGSPQPAPALAPAQSSNAPPAEIKSEKYIVKARDTFTSIARAKGIPLADLIAANKNINPNALQIGQIIILPATAQNNDLASRKDDRTRDPEEDEEDEESEEGAPDDLAAEIITYAKEFLGYPYSYGAAGPKSFDCSGFTSYVFGHFDIDLPHNSASQAKKGTKVTRSKLQPGDLVFFQTSGKNISHVGIYIGDGDFIHASTGEKDVEITSLSEAYYDKRYVTARRILD